MGKCNQNTWVAKLANAQDKYKEGRGVCVERKSTVPGAGVVMAKDCWCQDIFS